VNGEHEIAKEGEEAKVAEKTKKDEAVKDEAQMQVVGSREIKEKENEVSVLVQGP
jgi:hypothetical protein